MKNALIGCIVSTCLSFSLVCCGTYVPDIIEAWEPVAISREMELSIKQQIFCEIIDAVRVVNNRYNIPETPSQKAIPNSYGVQLQYSLTIDENSAVNPSVGLIETLPNARIFDINIGQNLGLATGFNLSSTATRTDTFYSYYNIGRISAPGANSWCHDSSQRNLDGSSPLLKVDLGIQRYLLGAVWSAAGVPSSDPPKGKKDLKLDVYSYEVKFIVLSNGSLNPSIKLASVSANGGSPSLLTGGRTRTHDMILTFGPSEIIPGSGIAGPAYVATQTHFTSQLNQTLQSLRGPPLY